MKRSSKKEQKKIALEHVKKLFLDAKKNPSMGDRYVAMARKIAMKFNLRLPRELKRKFCKHCYSYFKSGNYRVRTRKKMVVYYCLKCKKYMRFKIEK